MNDLISAGINVNPDAITIAEAKESILSHFKRNAKAIILTGRNGDCMIRDITIGQYYKADSVIHRLDPRVKLMGTLIFIISLFME